MKRLTLVLAIAGIALVAIVGVDGLRDATDRVVRAGQGAVDAGQSVIDTGRGAIEAGQDAIGQARDTTAAVRQVNDACDLVRTAVRPETSGEESAALLQRALGVVDSVVTTYPGVPGVRELRDAVGTARGVLTADPSGQALRANPGAIEAACSRIPPIP